ncbi:MAG TPA: hypothetical protein VLC09_00265 [Polyangiaceae bacterium]|nr:hypothetical protein [Polyangiaceae bacterium]
MSRRWGRGIFFGAWTATALSASANATTPAQLWAAPTAAAAAATSTTTTTAAPTTAAPAAAAPAAAAPASKPASTGAVARLSVPKKPVYPLTCTVAGGEVVESRPAKVSDPPTAEQLAAYEMLRSELGTYEKEARAYQGRLTQIVRHHYEDRRRRVLAAIDGEIQIEKDAFVAARDEAIVRLEEFIVRYSGEHADPEATPDAMFRLAALYEERARESDDADLIEGLRPAIALYRDVVAAYPGYREAAAVHYYLGHALTDSGRLSEAQQAWRSLVCHNRYQVTSDPTKPEALRVQVLPQDHDEEFWTGWYNRHPIPLDQLGKRGNPKQVTARDEELVFGDPYEGCEPIPQIAEPGEEPRYLGEVWWQLGNHHFDGIDRESGPYNLNRAVSAYEHGLVFHKPPLYGVTLYKQAWTYYKQQRYQAAVEWFVKLLHYTDEQERLTGDPGADFRSEAYTYIAGSLTYVDFTGPPATDPFIPRSDVLDLEPDPLRAEEKMAVALTRVQDPALVPQDRKWSVEIYKGLAQEFIEISQNNNAIAALELTVQKFPLDRDAPVMVNRVAELYDQLARLAPPGSPIGVEFAGKALDARTQLAKYVGTTSWTNANRDDPEALARAEELVRGGLRRAAADHTNFARAYKDRAFTLSDGGQQRAALEQAVTEYRLAASAWQAYLVQDANAVDAYDTRFWLADSHFWVAVLQVPLGRVPRPEEVEASRNSAVAVRDSNEDDRYKQPAAFYVVTLADKLVEAENQAFVDSGGTQGFVKKDQVTFTGEGGQRKPVKEELPGAVKAAVCARDEYNARMPLDEDPEKNGLLYATQAAEYFFVYGQFEEARRRLVPLYEKYCGKNKWGYNAWDKLVSMSNFQGNAAESRALVDSKSCAFDDESRLAEDSIRTPVRQGVAYLDARKLFEEAMAMSDGPERDKKWRAAAAAYKVALAAAPDRDEAPEAAMNGAYAYKQVGEYDQAIAMYQLFIAKYGDSKTLAKLKTTEPGRYEERVKFLGDAYAALAGAYVLFFDYPKAAETFDTISGIVAFAPADRKNAARQALVLYSNLDDSAGMQRVRKRFASLSPSDEELAEADFVVASAALKKWDPQSADSGANRTARNSAQAAMEQYYTANKGRKGAQRFVVQAAYHVSVSKRVGKSAEEMDWWKSTVAAFDRYLAAAPQKDGKSSALGGTEANMAAEADYTLLDAELKRSFDYEAGFHRYKGTVVEVVQQYTKDAQVAKVWYDKLGRIVDRYLSQKWAAVAVARQGSVYDSLRTGLYNTRPPELKMFTPQQERALKLAEDSGDEKLLDQADQIRFGVNDAWRKKRDTELDGADRIVVDRYSTAVLLAQRYNVSDASLTRAIRRLAFLTDVVGEAKMATYTGSIKDLGYKPGMFQRMRPGVTVAPTTTALPAASPAGAAP